MLIFGGVHCSTTITLSQSVAVPVTTIVLGTGIPIPTTLVMVTLQVIEYSLVATTHGLSAVVAFLLRVPGRGTCCKSGSSNAVLLTPRRRAKIHPISDDFTYLEEEQRGPEPREV